MTSEGIVLVTGGSRGIGAATATLLAEHRSGRANHAKPLWAVIMLGYWLENWAG